MAWLQLIIPTNDTDADQLSDALMEQGAVSVTLQDMQDQPMLEPAIGTTPMWSQTRAVGLFDATSDLKQIVKNLEQQLRKDIPDWKGEQLEDKDWVRAWMDNFKPMQFGKKTLGCTQYLRTTAARCCQYITRPRFSFWYWHTSNDIHVLRMA